MIQLKGDTADRYRSYLQAYRQHTGKEPGPAERTEAFFSARSQNAWDRPWWCREGAFALQ